MIPSPYNSIRFDGSGSRRLFSTTDSMAFEFLHTRAEVPGPPLLSDLYGNTVAELAWNTVPVNSETSVSYYDLRCPEPGDYTVAFNGLRSDILHITDNEEELENTVLLQYSVCPCSQREDVYAAFPGRQLYFEARYPGGFRDQDWEFSVEGERIETPLGDIVVLAEFEATDRILRIGDSSGLTIDIGERLNMILACPLLFVDGVRYAHSEANGIESIVCDERGERFVFAARLRQCRFVSQSHEAIIRTGLRKVPGKLRRLSDRFRKVMS